MLGQKNPGHRGVNTILITCMMLYYFCKLAFPAFTGYTYTAYTPAENGFNNLWFVTHHSFFKFRVQTCEEAHLVLSEYPGNDTNKAYEIIIGEINIIQYH